MKQFTNNSIKFSLTFLFCDGSDYDMIISTEVRVMNFENLNANQKEAVLTDSQYVRIIAGAGSGKTRVLTTRIAYLILEKGVYPNKILAITFTNKAANEMKERVNGMIQEGSTVSISTIHSLCVRILRKDILTMGYPRNFTVMDADDQKAILKEAYRELNLDKQTYSYASVLDYIANNKAASIDPDRAERLAVGFKGEMDKAKLYRYYVERQNALYALDFDDLLLVTVKMFKRYSEVLAKWQKCFNYIHVDEFQDIDQVQYELIRLLAGTQNNVYVVGDPDQTIYTWRGADVNIIMNFEKDFAPLHTIILNENYRSTQMILDGANSLIKNNSYRVKKDLYTNKEAGEKITHYTSASEEYEAAWIARKIAELHSKGTEYRDIAILYRSNYLSRAIEKGLLEEHIPYVIFGGVKFYERAEIKDALCYLRMITMNDDLALLRIINNPKRGLGTRSMEKLRDRSKELKTTMYEVLKNESDILGPKNRETVKNFVQMIEKWKKEVDETSIDKMLEKVIDESGYRRMLEENKETERIENLKELINDIGSFMINFPDSTLDEYLQIVSLYGETNETERSLSVQLMTVHAAKGLEFNNVFVCGMSDGIFPSDRSMQDGKKGLEEERRLAYVAYTRARNKLYLTDSSGFNYVLNRVKTTSRFIDELDPSTVEHLGVSSKFQDPHEQPLFIPDDEFDFEEVSAPVTPKGKKGFKKGDKISHAVFGEGIVLGVEGNFVQIAFKFPVGVKKVLATHPSLKKLVS